ncbi:MAG: NUDIX domain-containing protein [Bacteroidales bacterium]|nr:NUDIX domain-containing protein [Bacteroidales bacterium]
MTGEMVPVVEPEGEVIGRAPRSYVHGRTFILHPVVHLHIINRKGEVYLQKRAMTKNLLPGRWDTAVGGHIGYGESVAEALFREAEEELGLTDFNPTFICDYVYESGTERELVNVFAIVGDFSPKPDGDEVSEGRYWSVKEIEESFEKSILTPNFEREFSMIRKDLEALL